MRKPERPNGRLAKLQITPSTASFQARKGKVRTLGKQAKGTTPEQLIDTLTPVLRGWANYHRHSICGETFAQLDNFVWQRVYRWATRRHSDKTGRWLVERYFPHRTGRTVAVDRSGYRPATAPGAGGNQTAALSQGQGRSQPL